MGVDGYLSLSEAASFLKISRPTLNSRRKEFNLNELQEGTSTLLKKSELLSLYAKEHSSIYPSTNLVVTEEDKIADIMIDENTFDLRKLNIVDAYGAISLLGTSVEILESQKLLHLVVSDTSAICTLSLMGFFSELERRFEGRVFWNKEGFPQSNDKGIKAFLPIKYIAFKGQERQFLEDLNPLLKAQGFDEATIGYLGWMIGEVADNALTHAQGPCYILLGQFSKKNSYLEVAIGDTGKGIYGSLKENAKYATLTDEIAFIKAFQSSVSCWPDDKPRGKGLSDVLSMAMGSGSLLRVDSKDKGLQFNFSNGQKELQFRLPTTTKGGARFCWLLINNDFKHATRSEVDEFITREIENRQGRSHG